MNERLKTVCDRISLMAFTGLVLSVVGVNAAVPPQPVSSGSLVFSPESFLGLSTFSWLRIMSMSFVVLCLSLLPNVFLEREKLLNLVKRRFSEGTLTRGLLGVIAAVALVAFLAARPASYLRDPEPLEPANTSDIQTQVSTAIAGLSLAQLSERTQVPVSFLREKLKIPASAPNDRPLAQISAVTGITLAQFQDAVAAYYRERPLISRP